MRTTIVPAQITSVEDKVAGRLSFNQLLLLVAPLFLSLAVFTGLPPFGKLHSYKVTIVTVCTLVTWTLAIRFRDKLIIEWLVLRSSYNHRPRYYVFSKNSSYQRSVPKPLPETTDRAKHVVRPLKLNLNSKELACLYLENQ